MILFEWFDANCAWIYNNTCIFNTVFYNNVEMPFGAVVLKCLLMSLWYMMILHAPALIVLRGVGYIIGGWIGALPALFFRDDD